MNETYSRFRVGKHLSDIFPIKNRLQKGDALSPFLFNFALVYAIRRVQVNQGGLKLSGTHQLLVFVNDVNIADQSVRTVKKNIQVVSKQIGPEVNAANTV
jgi:hypothetical protein